MVLRPDTVIEAFEKVRAEGRSEGLAQAAEIARKWQDPEMFNAAALSQAQFIEKDILATSPIPDYAQRIREEQREVVFREAARLVCGYCDGHFTMWESEARRGALGSGNWIHREKGDAAHHQLCAATGIYNKLAYARCHTQ